MRPRLGIALGAAAMIGLAGASLAVSEAGSPTADLVAPAGAALLGAPDTTPSLPGLSPVWVLSTLRAAADAETPPDPAVRPSITVAAPPAVEAAAPEPMPAPRPASHSTPVLAVLTSVPIPVTLPRLPLPVSLPPVVTPPASPPAPSTGHHGGSGHGHGHGHSGGGHSHHHGGRGHH